MNKRTTSFSNITAPVVLSKLGQPGDVAFGYLIDLPGGGQLQRYAQLEKDDRYHLYMAVGGSNPSQPIGNQTRDKSSALELDQLLYQNALEVARDNAKAWQTTVNDLTKKVA